MTRTAQALVNILLQRLHNRGSRTPTADVFCANDECRISFGSYPNGMEPEGSRVACPSCGSHARKVLQYHKANLSPRATLGYNGFPAGKTSRRKRFAWGSTGWEFSELLKKFIKKDDHFSKHPYLRYEHIEDGWLGVTLHHQDHPLTEHIGHGSDKGVSRKIELD